MTGQVNDRTEAVIALRLRGPTGLTADLQAVIDTGFTDFLALAPETVELIHLPLRETARFTLANGIQVALDVFRGEVLWDGQWRGVLVTASPGDPLVGMSLLYGSKLEVKVIPGGRVCIEPIPET